MATDGPADPGHALRRLAEERLRRASPSGGLATNDEGVRVLHELQVHQVELEMQQEELLESRARAEAVAARYADFFDFSPAGFFSLRRDKTIAEVNLVGARMLGLERSRLTGRRFDSFVAHAGESRFNEFIEQVFAGAPVATCEVDLDAAGQPPRPVAIEATLSSDGQECRAVVVDLTAQKRAEEARESLRAQLQQAQRLEAIGRLAGGIAHDFNNMLAVILGYTVLALENPGADERLRSDLNEVRKAAERSAALTKQLLAFARKQTIAPRVLDLNEAVEGALKMLGRLIGEDIELAWRPGAGLWPVYIDPGQVDQLFTNLCLNARNAMAGAGRLTIETGNCSLDSAYCARHPGSVAGEFVRLTVTDTGAGMNSETLGHIFEPFFTTQKAGEGTGLGLATVFGIVQQNNGTIDVESEQGRGTSFLVHLPRHTGPSRAPRREPEASAPVGNGETILVVEDEPAVLALVQRSLTVAGYSVLAAGTPDGALERASEHPGEIHLLVTDVIMPVMDGKELARRLAYLHPGVKCLFMSGYTSDIIGRHGVLEAGTRLIEKPFTADALTAAVREILGPASPRA